MRDFPSCFGENGVQVADASCSSVVGSKTSQNSVTCVYKCKILGKSCLITIVWSKNLMGQCLSVEIDDTSHQCICKVDVKPSLFSKRKGSKCLEVNSSKIEVFWDLCLAKFGSGPEPLEGYYIAVVFRGEIVLLIGDLKKEAFKKTGAITASFSNATLISRGNTFLGRGFMVPRHNSVVTAEFTTLKSKSAAELQRRSVPCGSYRFKTVMQIKHLRWKFRGNYDLGRWIAVEVFWDVHNWLFGSNLGNAVFLFQSSLSAEKLWTGQSVCDSPVFLVGLFGEF
ncbi:hypothetical protein DH2020_036005 [Rehmannia glutinosa]|uniref:Uncharacterized protein n=1 Tax=Rehmannia glutinosa TaxID=99300 RepID=A0ABR0V866_REHGL